MGVWSADVLGGDSSMGVAMRMLAAAGLAPEEFAFADKPGPSNPVSIHMITCANPFGAPQNNLIVRNADNYNDWYQALNMREGAAAQMAKHFPAMVTIANADDKDGNIKNQLIADIPEGTYGHTYHVLAVLLMAAGAYFDPPFKQAVLKSIEQDKWARSLNDHDRRFVMSQFWKLVHEYDVNGGHAVEYVQEGIDDILKFGRSKYSCEEKAFALVEGGYNIIPSCGGSPIFVPDDKLDPDFFPMIVYFTTVKRTGIPRWVGYRRVGQVDSALGAFGGFRAGECFTPDSLVDEPKMMSLFSEILDEPKNLNKQQLVEKMRLLAAMHPDHPCFDYMPGLNHLLRLPGGGAAETPGNGGNDAPTNRPIPERVTGKLKKQLHSASGFNPNKICVYCAEWRGPHNRKQLMICSGCKLVYYCDKECQRADWKHHKVACYAARAAAAAADNAASGN